MDSVRRMTVLLAAQYAPIPGTPFRAALAPMVTIFPEPRSIISGTVARTECKSVRTFRSCIRSQLSGAVSCTGSPI